MTTPPAHPDGPHPAPAAQPDAVADTAAPRPWDEEEAAADHWAPPRGGARTARRWWAIGLVAVLLMSGLAAWFGFSATAGRVHWVYTGHQVVSDSQVDIRFDVRRDPDRAVRCQLEAQDGSHTVVGRTTVDVAPAESSPSRHVDSVQTASRAITGYVVECWYADEAPRHTR